MRACYRHFDTCMLHLFCKINPPTYISTRDRPRYWPGAGRLSKGSVRDWIHILKSYWPGAGRLSKGSVRGWIHILKSYWPGAGRLSKGSVRDWIKVWLNGRTGAGRLSKGSVRFGTKAGLKPVHDGIGSLAATSWSTMGL